MRLPVVFAAPHRPFFVGGLTMLILSMLLWLASRTGLLATRLTGLDHAFVISHSVLSFFIFGFLITVFPRWLDRPPIAKRTYVVTAICMLLGTLALVCGLALALPLVLPGLALMAAGWVIVLAALARVLWQSEVTVIHAQAVLPALTLGFAALLAYALWALGGEWQWLFVGTHASLWLFLAPVFLAISHRMIPFFSQAALGDYEMYRPASLLWLLIAGCFVHFGLAALHRYDWLWLADFPLAAIGAWLWWRWQPGRSRGIALLRSLFVAYAWFWLAMLLSGFQSLWFLIDDNFLLGRAPVHALTIGFFTSMAIAMVTRVSLGHSGRALQMAGWQWLVLLGVQAVALTRIVAEWPGVDAGAADILIDVSAWLWLAVLMPWVAWFIYVCTTPRVDGKPG